MVGSFAFSLREAAERTKLFQHGCVVCRCVPFVSWMITAKQSATGSDWRLVASTGAPVGSRDFCLTGRIMHFIHRTPSVVEKCPSATLCIQSSPGREVKMLLRYNSILSPSIQRCCLPIALVRLVDTIFSLSLSSGALFAPLNPASPLHHPGWFFSPSLALDRPITTARPR